MDLERIKNIYFCNPFENIRLAEGLVFMDELAYKCHFLRSLHPFKILCTEIATNKCVQKWLSYLLYTEEVVRIKIGKG